MLAVTGFVVACSSSSTKEEAKDSGSTTADALAGDAGGAADAVADVGPCEPGSVRGFSPAPVAPVIVKACSTTTEIPVFVGDCYTDAGTQAGCASWKSAQANFSCAYTCLNTQYGAQSVVPGVAPPPPLAPWGPTVAIPNPGQSNWLNPGACLAVADPSTEGQACATALTNAFECEYFACAAVPGCSVPNPPESEIGQERLKALTACFSSAGEKVCSSYADAAKTACANPADGGPGAFCFSAATDKTALTKMLTQQCGGGDGGGYGK